MRSMASAHLRRLALACALAAAAPAAASGLQVAPTGLEFAPGGAAQALWLTNTGDSELRAQVRTFAWTQTDGHDVLEPTRALIASPPMLRIGVGERQLVRVIRADQAAAAGGEQAFRLLVDELPQDAQPAGVQYVLRYSIPVFVAGQAPVQDPAGALRWSIQPTGNGLAVEVSNSASAHVQLTAVGLLPASGAPVELVPGLLGYVLGGATMRWSLDMPATSDPAGARLKVQVNGIPAEPPLSSGPAR